jgi:SulP family sulfate permease
VVILDLSSVPAIDATGLVSLESAVERLAHAHVYVILAGVQKQPARALARSGLRRQRDRLALCRSFEAAVAVARRRSRAALGLAGAPLSPLDRGETEDAA